MGEPAVPAVSPGFDTNATNVSAPAGGIITDGWGGSNTTKPPSNWTNYIWNNWGAWLIFLWIEYKLLIGALVETALTITSNVITPTQGSHQIATGTVNLINPTNFNPGRIIRFIGGGATTTLVNNATPSGSNIPMVMADGQNVTLSDTSHVIEFRQDPVGSFWYETFRSISLVNGISNPHTFEARLTALTNVPVPTADVLAATSVYLTPFKGNNVALYNSTTSQWALVAIPQIALVVPNTTATMYDVFLYMVGGTPTLLAVQWTNDTTRATALAFQNGVYVSSADSQKRYVGTIRTTAAAGQTEDSVANRFVWSYYNRVSKKMKAVDATASWSYNSASFRQSNGSTANQLDFVIGVSEDFVNAMATSSAYDSNPVTVAVGIGINSTTVSSADVSPLVDGAANSLTATFASLSAQFLGRNYLAWLEAAGSSGTTTWIGTQAPTVNGIIGTLMG